MTNKAKDYTFILQMFLRCLLPILILKGLLSLPFITEATNSWNPCLPFQPPIQIVMWIFFRSLLKIYSYEASHVGMKGLIGVSVLSVLHCTWGLGRIKVRIWEGWHDLHLGTGREVKFCWGWCFQQRWAAKGLLVWLELCGKWESWKELSCFGSWLEGTWACMRGQTNQGIKISIF